MHGETVKQGTFVSVNTCTVDLIVRLLILCISWTI